jgi:hypothetical protein
MLLTVASCAAGLPLVPTPTPTSAAPTAQPTATTLTVPIVAPVDDPATPTPPSTPVPPGPARPEGHPAPRTPTPTVASPTAMPATPPPAPTERLRIDGPPHDPGPLDWAHPGPYIQPGYTDFKLNSFGARQHVVTTYYFYWHDLTDPTRQARIKQFWAQQPPNPSEYSFLNPATHLKEFADMQAAGLDFALPVYWGEPGHPGRSTNFTAGHYWSTEGIPPIVEALDELAAAGHPFKVGMFYDTTILANADLTTPAGKEYFYVNVRDFYSRIPPKYWAAIDGKPVVWLYDTQWVSKYDQSSFDYLGQRFAQDFGGLKPYLVREWQWYESKGVQPPVVLKSDNMYSWGAAPSGFNPDRRFGVAEVGPGFSNAAYCHGGTAANCFDVDRQNGAYYARQLRAAVSSGRSIIAVETWNEFSEGSDISETVQFGRQYIDLTRKYAGIFHAASG